MKSVLLVFLFAFSSLSAQKGSFTPVRDEAGFRQKLAEASKATVAIKADFVQEKNLSMLSEKIISKGGFWFKKEGKVRLEYKTPFKYLMIINGSKVLIKDNDKESKFDTKNNKIFKQVNNLIVSSLQGTILNSPDFKAKISESGDRYLMELTPLAKGIKDFFSNIHIFIDKKDYSVTRLELIEVSGDDTVITFSNKELNGKLGEELFGVN